VKQIRIPPGRAEGYNRAHVTGGGDIAFCAADPDALPHTHGSRPPQAVCQRMSCCCFPSP